MCVLSHSSRRHNTYEHIFFFHIYISLCEKFMRSLPTVHIIQHTLLFVCLFLCNTDMEEKYIVVLHSVLIHEGVGSEINPLVVGVVGWLLL